jgi:hypothetical protein
MIATYFIKLILAYFEQLKGTQSGLVIEKWTFFVILI